MRSARPILLTGFLAGLATGIILFMTLERPSHPVGAQDHMPTAEEQAKLRTELQGMPDISSPFVKISKLVTPSVVHIVVSKTIQVRDPWDDFFDDPFFRRRRQPRRFEQQGQGTGFIVDANGLIMTNNHVIDGADKIIVRLFDGRELPGKLIGHDNVTDVALVKVEAQNLCPVMLGDSAKLEVGEWVVAIGNPFGLESTVTVGIVSAKGRSHLGILDQEDFIQTDAAINPGNSGGPLVNTRGEVIGINSAIYSRSGGYQGIGFAVPINLAKQVKEQLLKNGRVIRGSIGVKLIDLNPELADRIKAGRTQGAVVSEIIPHSPATEAGLKVGDVIVKFAGTDIRDSQQLRGLIASQKVGTGVKLELVRRGKSIELEIGIEESAAEY
jgi:serine protease Do